MDRWGQFSRQTWAVRIVLLASAAVVITGLGGWVVGLLVLVFMAVVVRLAWPHLRRR
jgi:apolipoprotein N-acyltransferase